MSQVEHNSAKSVTSSTISYEGKTTRFGWALFLALTLGDTLARQFIVGQPFLPLLTIAQASIFLIFLVLSRLKLDRLKTESISYYNSFQMLDLSLLFVTVLLVSTYYYGVFLSFVFLLPVMFFSVSQGYKKCISNILICGSSQVIFTIFAYSWLEVIGGSNINIHPLALITVLILQYSVFAIFSRFFCKIHNDYIRSEEENNILIERLGDKYVQLEQAKKKIQAHYEKLQETNKQLEESNSRLTDSLAEFFTLQQISQAITSIFDVNELLKFVNDVILGVMGVYHSTIALCHGPQNRLKVQVSSIFEKKDLAIMSDYINCDIIKTSIEEKRSMIDNAATPAEYPFTKGRGIQSLICVPLLAKGNTLGVVLVEHAMKDAFDKDNVRFLEVITQQVSIAIENAQLYQQMHDLATMDGLTGAYNRLYFQDKLEEEFKKAQEKAYDLSFIIFDIDHFKKFNDTYGHLFGDQVLKSLSTHIMKTLRKEDIFARYGGEEFVILMPHTTIKQAYEKAEELRISVSQLSITDRVVSASITISVGVSTYPESASRPQELISSADDALYEAKRDGRNLVRVARIRK